MSTKNLFKQRRFFSESFKKARVKDFESGKHSVLILSREYNIAEAVLYRWIRKYSLYYKTGYRIVVEPKSMSKNNEDLRRRVAELEAILGRKQMEIEFLEKLIDISSEEVGEDLKKKFGIVRSNGSGKTKPHTGGK